MRVPVSWLRELVELPAAVSSREIAAALIRAGLEVETVDEVGAQLQGPLLVGRVLEYVEEPQKNGKTIRWCQVDVGEAEPRGIVCGARNFEVNDLVVVALPGAVLPGPFPISARKTYGHVSDGMICSERELGSGDDHEGILVLDPALGPTGVPGADATELLLLRQDVLEIAVTPDRGYTMSVRGVARELATAYQVPFVDPVDYQQPTAEEPAYPVRLEDPGCPAFAVAAVSGFDPSRPSPRWLRRRLQLCGTRPISLSVDVTNYVMYELGQPIHGYDREKLSGPIVVRAGGAAEKLVTLDDVTRELDSEDMVVTDDSGPIGLGGVMGGSTTELAPDTAEILIEAAWWDPVRIARTSRRHKLSSEASKRFERGVDSRMQLAAAHRVAELLTRLGGGSTAPGSLVGEPPQDESIVLSADHAAKVAGYPIDAETFVRRLADVGCEVARHQVARDETDRLLVTPPPWRPDLTDPNDLAEEAIRLEGYEAVPSVLPVAPPGRGLTARQRGRRAVGRVLAGAGFTEVLAYPFVGDAEADRLGIAEDDPRRQTVRLANPVSEEQPGLRTTLLPGLLAIARRNVGRGQSDLAIFESGSVFLPTADHQPAPRPGVASRPSDQELAGLNAALPDQPRRLAIVLTGNWTPSGWWGSERAVTWADAIQAVRQLADALDVEVTVRSGEYAPWHPGRCAELVLPAESTGPRQGDRPDAADEVIGHAGELHPRVCQAYELPARSCAVEIDLDRLLDAVPEVVQAPSVSGYPVAKEDVALVVAADVPAAEVQAALRDGAGELLESLRLFDVFTGEQLGEDRKSLAFALRFRAPDRTLTEAEVAEAKQAAVDEAARRVGAVQRGV